MDELVTWLRGVLDDEEQAARAAAEVIPDGEGWYRVPQLAIADPEFLRLYGRAYDHMARHDPARVLKQVAAMRAIVDACEETLAGEDAWDPQLDGGSGEEFELARFVLQQLVSSFDDRPGYDPSWAPS